jgi:hypothetical protein
MHGRLRAALFQKISYRKKREELFFSAAPAKHTRATQHNRTTHNAAALLYLYLFV